MSARNSKESSVPPTGEKSISSVIVADVHREQEEEIQDFHSPPLTTRRSPTPPRRSRSTSRSSRRHRSSSRCCHHRSHRRRSSSRRSRRRRRRSSSRESRHSSRRSRSPVRQRPRAKEPSPLPDVVDAIPAVAPVVAVEAALPPDPPATAEDDSLPATQRYRAAWEFFQRSISTGLVVPPECSPVPGLVHSLPTPISLPVSSAFTDLLPRMVEELRLHPTPLYGLSSLKNLACPLPSDPQPLDFGRALQASQAEFSGAPQTVPLTLKDLTLSSPSATTPFVRRTSCGCGSVPCPPWRPWRSGRNSKLPTTSLSPLPWRPSWSLWCTPCPFSASTANC